MKAEIHLTNLDKKVLNYMLENNLTKASTKRNKYILRVQLKNGKAFRTMQTILLKNLF